VVADGMGGHRAGATASQVTVAAIGEVFSGFVESHPEEMLRDAIETANERVHAMAVENTELRGMGTTAVALLLGPGSTGWVAHVGDSRAYRLRGERFEALTRDHSVVAELERRGLLSADEAAVHPRRNEILRCVGVHPDVEVETSEIEVEPGDLFLLCSDGLTGMLDEMEIADVAEHNTPYEAARILVGRANEAGGQDNVTVQIARVQSPGSETLRPAATPVQLPERRASRGARDLRQRRAVVVAAVLIAGLAALTLLWQIYSLSSG